MEKLSLLFLENIMVFLEKAGKLLCFFVVKPRKMTFYSLCFVFFSFLHP